MISRWFLFAFAVLSLWSFEGRAATIPTVTQSYGAYSFSLSDPLSASPGTVDMEAPGTSRRYNYNFYTGSPGEGVLSLELERAGIVEGTHLRGVNNYTKPVGLAATENYLAVFGNGHQAGTAIFTLTQGVTSFSFLWGTIDAYNWIDVESNAGRYTVYGADILKLLSAATGTVDRYFTLIDLSGIKSLTMHTCYSAFEIARVAAVPLPAAGLLFGAAVAGLAIRRRKRR